MSGTKKVVLALTLVVLLACGVWAGWRIAGSPPTYDGTNTDLVGLYEDPSSYDNSNADGAAAIMVNENLEKTAADNVVGGAPGDGMGLFIGLHGPGPPFSQNGQPCAGSPGSLRWRR